MFLFPLQLFCKLATVGIEMPQTPWNENGVQWHVCISKTAGPGQETSKNSKWRVKTFCSLFNKALCKKHMIHICSFCQNK